MKRLDDLDCDSSEELYENWTRWLEERENGGRSSESRTKSCMTSLTKRSPRRHETTSTISPNRRYLSPGRGSQRDRYAVSMETLESEILRRAASGEFATTNPKKRQSTQSISSLACVAGTPKQASRDNEYSSRNEVMPPDPREALNRVTSRRQSKLSSLACIAGKHQPKFIHQGGTESTSHDVSEGEGRDWFADDESAQDDEQREDWTRDLRHSQSTARQQAPSSSQTRRVRFFEDDIYERKVNGRPKIRNDRLGDVDHDTLERDVEELRSELADMQLLNRLDELESWLGLHDGALQKVIRHGNNEHGTR